MNAILKKLEQKFRAASLRSLPGSCLGVDLNGGRGEAASDSCLGAGENGGRVETASGSSLGVDLNRGEGVAAPIRGKGAGHMEQEIRPRSWEESETVSRLSAFMKEYGSQGFYLCRDSAGEIVLHMEPGVSPKAPERWDLALHAEHLMAEALEDLTRFLETGALNLKDVEVVKMQLRAPSFSPEQEICCTTVPGALVKLKAESRLHVVRDALTYERTHTNRPAMVKVIRERLRELEETSGGKAPVKTPSRVKAAETASGGKASLSCSTQGEFF